MRSEYRELRFELIDGFPTLVAFEDCDDALVDLVCFPFELFVELVEDLYLFECAFFVVFDCLLLPVFLELQLFVFLFVVLLQFF